MPTTATNRRAQVREAQARRRERLAALGVRDITLEVHDADRDRLRRLAAELLAERVPPQPPSP